MSFATRRRPDAKRRQTWGKLRRRIISLLILFGMLCGSNAVVLPTSAESDYTIYFAAPASWSDNTVQVNVLRGDGNNWQYVTMANTGKTYTSGTTTYKIYSAVVSELYGGFDRIQFQLYVDSEWRAEYDAATGWVTNDVIQGKMWVPATEITSGKDTNGSWVDYTCDPDNTVTWSATSYLYLDIGSITWGQDGAHILLKYYNTSGQWREAEMSSFEGTLYQIDLPDDMDLTTNGKLQFVRKSADGGDLWNQTGELTLPGNTNVYILTDWNNAGNWADHVQQPTNSSGGGGGGGGGGTTTTTRIYFDATLSKLSYENSAGGSYCIPAIDGTIRFYATGSGKSDLEGAMTKASDYTAGGNTWSDVYYADIPEGYQYIAFSAFDMSNITNYGGHGESTEKLTIPTGLSAPCFYADTGDKVVYDGGTRDGYWGEVYTLRNVETAKGVDVVDITRSAFTPGEDTLYLKTTFYDYYTDYELNGFNRDTYTQNNGMSQRNWVTFRQFNQALSTAYSGSSVSWPLYVGHFQPPIGGDQFDSIGSTLNLYGWSSGSRAFYASNNSYWDAGGGVEKMRLAMQGLVYDRLVNGNLMASGGSLRLPLFNKDFILGANSKNAVLGEVYENVSFPFTKQDVANNGVEYWVFDSDDTTLAMQQDPTTGEYYLTDVGNQRWSKNVNEKSEDQGTYGFFPFNATASNTHANTYNYGFGTRIDLTFRLTEDGTVLDKHGNKVPIEFTFSGDDDVWVFIDGRLALDVGGAHSAVEAKLNFKTKEATVYGVKFGGSSDGEYSERTTSFTLTGANIQEHTLTMFYMERGMWGSNMRITFNFPDENQLEVGKRVDDSAVNSLFDGVFDDQSLFTFHIQNLATHFGAVNANGVTHEPIYPDLGSGTTQAANAGNTFEKLGSYSGKSNVLHWYAGFDDATSEWRHRRYGVYTLPGTVDISDMNQLSFYLYYDDPNGFSLSDLYIQLVDADATVDTLVADSAGSGDADAFGCIGSASTLSGKTYGSPGTEGQSWVKITLDLSKLDTGASFDPTRVKYFRFGCDNGTNIYLADFTFEPAAQAGVSTGFIAKQYEVPDYGSANTGAYQNAAGAVYTTNLGGSQAYVVSGSGTFVLENGETANFHDQFRRGSYIYLEEVLNAQERKLYDTSWTMYEDGVAVTTFGAGSMVTNPSTAPGMIGVAGTVVNDGRTEKLGTNLNTDGRDWQVNNNYGGIRPEKGGFVFRSYQAPDSTNTTTKIQVIFTNVVNTGSLTVSKGTEGGSETLTGTYQFYVDFYNVGGLGLETGNITTSFTLSAGESHTISGIPVGTEFRIYEVNPTDGSFLESVTVDGAGTSLSSGYIDGKSCTCAAGTVSGESNYTFTFNNAKRPVLSLELKKQWQDADGNALREADVPGTIYVRLLRRQAGASAWETVPGYEKVKVSNGYTPWVNFTYSFTGLDQYVDYTAATQVPWEYRVQELDPDAGYAPLSEGGRLGDRYIVRYSAVTASADGKTRYATITNAYEPKVNVSVTKQWTYADGSNYAANLPASVWVQLQCRVGASGAWTKAQDYELTAAENWSHTFEDLPNRISGGLEYSYRVVELDGENGNVVSDGARVGYNGTDYLVSYANADNAWTITNRMIPTATLEITKCSATDGAKLPGVEFTLEKLTDSGTVDTAFAARNLTTDGSGVAAAAGLSAGTYRLTETKTADGYSLLSAPITIVLTPNGDGSGYTAMVNGTAAQVTTDGSVTTVPCVVYNRSALEMPATGGGGFEIWILGGLCITAIPLLLYCFLGLRKKGGKYLST
ncbi:MAG: SpaA isopeptide-forming pilin-related protein [Faecousia sp.]